MRALLIALISVYCAGAAQAQSDPPPLCVETLEGERLNCPPEGEEKPRAPRGLTCNGNPIPQGETCTVQTFKVPSPSFSCADARTEAEITICKSSLLSDLDHEMAELYFALVEPLSGTERTSFVSNQRIWLKWRDTCPQEGDCVQRRYEQRIVDLAGPDRALPILGRAYRALAVDALEGGGQPVEVRLGEGRYERVLPDGTIEWLAFDGGASGVERPDGSGSIDQSSNAVVASFPALPDQFSDWGTDLETNLLAIVEQLLPATYHEGYRTLQASLPYSQRVSRHIQSIDFLVNQ